MIDTAFPLIFSALSDRGLVRETNEDVWAADGGCFVLADGMGGHHAGEIAAEMAAFGFLQRVKSFPGGSVDNGVDWCRSSLQEVNAEVYHAGCSSEDQRGMGSTLTALFFMESSVIVAHVGDSRAYRLREGALVQLTQDHTVVQKMQGIKEAQLFKHILTRAVGTQLVVKSSVLDHEVCPGDRYLLCSDGLTNYLNNQELLQLIDSPLPLELISSQCVDKAKERGGRDNITLLIVEVCHDLSRQ